MASRSSFFSLSRKLCVLLISQPPVRRSIEAKLPPMVVECPLPTRRHVMKLVQFGLMHRQSFHDEFTSFRVRAQSNLMRTPNCTFAFRHHARTPWGRPGSLPLRMKTVGFRSRYRLHLALCFSISLFASRRLPSALTCSQEVRSCDGGCNPSANLWELFRSDGLQQACRGSRIRSELSPRNDQCSSSSPPNLESPNEQCGRERNVPPN